MAQKWRNNESVKIIYQQAAAKIKQKRGIRLPQTKKGISGMKTAAMAALA